MKSIHLIFGCHSHQPVGNFDFVIEEAYHKAYLPFVQVLERYPAVRVTMHYTGPLWDWFLDRQPEYVQRLAHLVRNGQVEIMGGAYYEPLLCAIPERDAAAQIRRMQNFCVEHFGSKPRGMWLAERVWEPHMPRILAEAGVEYTALDDEHFLCSGLAPEELFGYYMTEDAGATLKVFPILKPLRYAIPFRKVEESIDYLRAHAVEGGAACAVIHDDGEKFGTWPGTYDSVYRQGWLEDFFQALTDNMHWIKSSTYSGYLEVARPLGRTYITCASYAEMMAWALPTEMQQRLHAVQEELKHDPGLAGRAGQFLRGGFWRGFLAKYPESNGMQKRMLRVSARLARTAAAHKRSKKLEHAEKLLHEGQCNCAYWHGVFGGLYLNHLRTAVFEKLIACDAVLDAIEHKEKHWTSSTAEDFDGDGNLEAVLENDRVALFFSPTDGGTLFEIDFKDVPFNFGNLLSRRPEAYHEALRHGVDLARETKESASIHDLVQAKETGLERYLVYDPYRRASMRNHFWLHPPTIEGLRQGAAPGLGGFATARYGFNAHGKHVALTATGEVQGRPITLTKTVHLDPGASSFRVQFEIENRGETPLEVHFGAEFGINLLTGSAPDRYYRSEDAGIGRPMLGEAGMDAGVAHLALHDEWQGLECGFRLEQPATIYRFPIETVSQSEAGQERTYQGSIVVACWALRCAPGAAETRSLTIELRSTRNMACPT